jgi:hypothetical protein
VTRDPEVGRQEAVRVLASESFADQSVLGGRDTPGDDGASRVGVRRYGLLCHGQQGRRRRGPEHLPEQPAPADPPLSYGTSTRCRRMSAGGRPQLDVLGFQVRDPRLLRLQPGRLLVQPRRQRLQSLPQFSGGRRFDSMLPVHRGLPAAMGPQLRRVVGLSIVDVGGYHRRRPADRSHGVLPSTAPAAGPTPRSCRRGRQASRRSRIGGCAPPCAAARPTRRLNPCRVSVQTDTCTGRHRPPT